MSNSISRDTPMSVHLAEKEERPLMATQKNNDQTIDTESVAAARRVVRNKAAERRRVHARTTGVPACAECSTERNSRRACRS